MYCPKCGAELNEGVKFCSKCGAAIQVEENPTSQEETKLEKPSENVDEEKKETKGEAAPVKKTRKKPTTKKRTTSPKTEKTEVITTVQEGDMPAPNYYRWVIVGVSFFGLLIFFGNGGFALSFWWWIVAFATAFMGWAAYEKSFDTKDSAKGGLMICVALCLLLVMCTGGGSNEYGSDNNSAETRGTSSSKKEDKCPDWVYGFWKVNTPYGMSSAAFFEGGGYTDNLDKGSGTFYYIESERMIHTSTGSRYEVDLSNHRIGIGEGYWMHKIN